MSGIAEYETPDKTIFVTGAGFSAAFNPKVPLMNGFLKDHQVLLEQADYRPLRKFIRRCKMHPARLNIETLFTFSAMSKPWQSMREAAESDLITALLTRLISDVIFHSFKDEKQEEGRWMIRLEDQKRLALENLARFLLNSSAHVITFNYDVLLDNFVDAAQQKRISGGEQPHERRFDIGYSYGFPALLQNDGRIVRSEKSFPDGGMQFLKLHGSLNWFAAAGAGQYPTYKDVLVYPCHSPAYPLRYYDLMFERLPLIVPPILDKASSLQSPAINLIWARAAKLVSLAETIVFLGYSLPPTDYYADFLFRHAPPRAKVTVVDFVDPRLNSRLQREKRRTIRQRYRSVFRHCWRQLGRPPQYVEFHFNGAVEYCAKLTPETFFSQS